MNLILFNELTKLSTPCNIFTERLYMAKVKMRMWSYLWLMHKIKMGNERSFIYKIKWAMKR